MATIDYKVDYEDERVQKVEDQHQDRVNDLEQTYAGMIGGAENIYQPQIDALDRWEDEQVRLQNERTDLTIQQIGASRATSTAQKPRRWHPLDSWELASAKVHRSVCTTHTRTERRKRESPMTELL